jgi:hypothetical protein
LWDDTHVGVFYRAVAAVGHDEASSNAVAARIGVEVVSTGGHAEAVHILELSAVHTSQRHAAGSACGLWLVVCDAGWHLGPAETQSVDSEDVVQYITSSETVEALIVDPLACLVTEYALEVQEVVTSSAAQVVAGVAHSFHSIHSCNHAHGVLDDRALAFSCSVIGLQIAAVGVEVVYALRDAEYVQDLIRANITC